MKSVRMRIVGRDKLDEFVGTHADARTWIENWLADVSAARWTSTHDIKKSYASASFVQPNLVIFNVKGNSYRLEVNVAFKTGTVVVVWVGTHGQYDKRNKKR